MSNRGEHLVTMTKHGAAIFKDWLGYTRPDAEYWFVEMGRLDHLNGSASYPFPSEFAAFRFAAAEKCRHPHRDLTVVDPDGTKTEITPLELGDIPDDDEDT
ncbi:hypothetical protein SEA_ROARY_83 [Mycobacterium phage Roary]|nr:hypothetical protein SEA_ROARY_83 [Mycobacterium phage Roary]